MINKSSWSGTARRFALGLVLTGTTALLPLTPAAAAAPDIDRLTPPSARWLLQTFPGIDQAGALADSQPAINDTPLTGTNISWENDVRFLGGQAVAFNGTSSSLSASPSALNTAGTFSLAAWVRLTDTSVSRVFASKAGAGRSTFSVGYDKAGNRWQVQLPAKFGKGNKASIARSASAPKIGLWTHLAVVHDAGTQTLTLLVNGVAEATVHNVTSIDDPAGEVRLGRGDTSWWKGNLAEVRLYDQPLVARDFTGIPGEPGLLRPWLIGSWDFQAASPCYEEDLDPTLCSAPDSTTGFGRRLALTKGSYVDSSSRGSQALVLDGTHWIDDPSDPHFGEATQEYGRSQINVGPWNNPVWQDGPVLLTTQSFTIATWVRLDPAHGAQTVVSQDGAGRSAFRVAYDPADGGQWVFAVSAGTDDSATTTATAPATGADQWHYVVGVLDATNRQTRLYVDGTSAGPVALDATWQPYQTSGALLVGRATTPAGPAEWLFGQVDEVDAYQGVLSDADVQSLFTA
ncbi:LamG domain-containing protein [Actinoplanes sp. L3-i22]|uniref:LamG domain-containing protein n=1 Tax=Actinoplanes sp. L3-i22 TaxID=2836373 RepID=UPI001C74D30A|nr:LamG domain-containing protein [Actinoplanes sp. L3-i22]BCY11663.1 hypothetical protein L3i22_067510 [Actinoplanes sp. L3-i22]